MKHRIPIIALSLLLTSCLTAEPTTQPATQPVSAPVNRVVGKVIKGLQAQLTANKTKHKLGEDVSVTLTIRNVSQKPVTLREHRDKVYGYCFFTHFLIKCPDGKTIVLGDPPGDYKAFPMRKLSFPRSRILRQQEAYTFTTTLNSWHVSHSLGSFGFVPGTYKIRAEYSVPALKDGWTGTLSSNTIDIQVSKEQAWRNRNAILWGPVSRGLRVGLATDKVIYGGNEPISGRMLIENVTKSPIEIAQRMSVLWEGTTGGTYHYVEITAGDAVIPQEKGGGVLLGAGKRIETRFDVRKFLKDYAVRPPMTMEIKASAATTRSPSALGVLVCSAPVRILVVNDPPSPATKPAAETQMSQIAQKRLRQKVPKITFNKNKLADVIQFFREFSNLDIVVNWKSLESAKIRKVTPVTLNLLNPSMKDILEGILKSAGSKVAPDYVVDEEGVITISMPKHLHLGCKITPPEHPTEKSRRTHKTLMKTLRKIDLSGIKFVHVVQYLREVLNVRIAVDWKALKSVGIDKKTLISPQLSNVSGKKVLEKTLDLAGGLTELSCVIDEEGVIQISTKKPDTTTSAPAVDPAVMAILKRLEAAGEKYPNITANIDYKVDMLQTGDTESRTGRVYYQGPTEKTPAKFRIHFDTLRQGKGPKIKDVVDYAFDGAWLTVRKERIKQMSRYQVARPGEKVNPLQLGKGPFPVPFGQKADTVIKHFRPTTRPTRNTGVSLVDRSTGVSPVKKHGRDGHATLKTDPKDTDYIKLTTRRRYRKEFSVVWLEMWISRKTSLPVKIVAEDRSENQTTVIFKDTKTPKSFDKKIFTLPRPPAGWEYHVEKFKGRVKP